MKETTEQISEKLAAQVEKMSPEEKAKLREQLDREFNDDCVVQMMVERKIPLTQRGYLALAYFGDKTKLEELEAEEIEMLPEDFELWPIDETQIN